ncbi:Ni/Co efflux regulator RcnB [Caulobacter ginsengisoli]|uniref:Ni/Co efflux regulator RcnB n=1 Tax=Caulobacter ginsengisoli TaxID=400775 RepID=A0ABU0IQB1_9CAUL|nr:RcnB family protein [Caulobacter ginsengisoli]MDQ0464202.1 Ni/Co efflux regulator RcnB [Caulobacter ginsengisoli]
MKRLLLTALALSLALPAASLADPGGKGGGKHDQRAGPPGQGWAPPGLAKKPYGLPPGQLKKRWQRGERLPVAYYGQPRYYVTQPVRYGLRPAPPGYRWVRVDDRYYLAQTRTGVIAEIISALAR